MTAANPHEALARERKASRLLAVAVKAGMSAAEAESATDDEKRMTAWAAGCLFPSDRTWALVISGLRRLEGRQAPAPAEPRR